MSEVFLLRVLPDNSEKEIWIHDLFTLFNTQAMNTLLHFARHSQ